MKKIIVVAQVFIVVMILVKMVTYFGVLQKLNISADTAMTSSALAQSKTGTERAASNASANKQTAAMLSNQLMVKDTMDDVLAEQRDLVQALAARKNELDNRENALRVDEQRLIAMRKDITEKMAILKVQEEKLAAKLDAAREEDVKRYKEMAKVYEATPPAKAGPMMEKLDIKTAAGITMNMKKDKAGALWAYITPQKAVEITKEITRSGGGL